MELNLDIYAQVAAIDWFNKCGSEPLKDIPFSVLKVPTVTEAVASALSANWQDVRTEAQGDLTGYLAKNHPDADTCWNRLAQASRERIQSDVMPEVNDALARISAGALLDQVLLDLNRIALHSTYAQRFRRIPDFFQRLFVVYERGYLPCGWSEDLQAWPKGQFIIY